ncbi:MAG: DUF4868 domain-containing protein [Lentisphaeria bacterium]|nr:DUF4868 domain-containing protein [Lentisphaeria bacterium]
MFYPSHALLQLKQVDFTQALLSFYVVKRNLHNKKSSCSVKQLELENSLKKRFRNIIINKISQADSIESYDYNQPEPDDGFLLFRGQTEELAQICQELEKNPPLVTEYNELTGSNFYLICLTTAHDEKKILAVRKISTHWRNRAVKSPLNLFYRNCQLKLLEESQIFQIDEQIDFLFYMGNIFIANKKNFETAMNFRQKLRHNRDVIIDEITRLAIFDHPELLRELIDDKLKLLRQLAQIQKSGYYRNAEYLRKAREVCRHEQWNIAFNECGQIIITPETLPEILEILNNDRLVSPINQEKFSVLQKHEVSTGHQK